MEPFEQWVDDLDEGAELNTPRADVGEILLGYYALGGKWKGFVGGAQAKKILAVRKPQIGDFYAQQAGQAKEMAKVSLAWAKKNGYKGKVVRAWWTARTGVLSKAVGFPVDSRDNPTDTLIQFSDGQFLGLSAKSKKGKGDIGFKNPGVGTIDAGLNINLKKIVTKHSKEFAKEHGLPDGKRARKLAIRSDPEVVAASNEARNKVLKAVRRALLKKLSSMKNKELQKYCLNSWMDSSAAVLPPYIKVTGHGTKAPFSATLHDPLHNDKATAIGSKKITVEKVGNDAVGIRAGGKKIFKMRAKFESQAMASTLKFTGDPW